MINIELLLIVKKKPILACQLPLDPDSTNIRSKQLISAETCRFAYRKEDALVSRVRAITDGSGHADIIQYLNDIAVLGRKNPEPLTAIGFDLTGQDKAATEADELADLLAEANGDKILLLVPESGRFSYRTVLLRVV